MPGWLESGRKNGNRFLSSRIRGRGAQGAWPVDPESPFFPAWVQAPRPDPSASRRGLAFVWLQSQYLKHLDQTEDFAFSPPGPPSTKTLSKNPTQPRPLANLLPLSRMFSVSSAGALFWSGWSPALTTQPSLDAGYCQCPAGPEDKTGADSSFPSPLNLLPFL